MKTFSPSSTAWLEENPQTKALAFFSGAAGAQGARRRTPSIRRLKINTNSPEMHFHSKQVKTNPQRPSWTRKLNLKLPRLFNAASLTVQPVNCSSAVKRRGATCRPPVFVIRSSLWIFFRLKKFSVNSIELVTEFLLIWTPSSVNRTG